MKNEKRAPSLLSAIALVTIYIYIYIRNVSKNMKPLWNVVQIVRETWVLVVKDKSNHPVADSLRSVPRDSWS